MRLRVHFPPSLVKDRRILAQQLWIGEIKVLSGPPGAGLAGRLVSEPVA
jgi:hypothetical protein